MRRSFDELVNSLKKSITPVDFFVDFPKVFLNLDDHINNLNLLNRLIGADNIEKEFEMLVKEHPEVMNSIPILLASHDTNFSIVNVPTTDLLINIDQENYKVFDDKYICYDFDLLNNDITDYTEFLKLSGLLDLINNKKIHSFVDYALGIEAGLDSNARKNRSGKIMEGIIEEFLKKSGIKYYKQMKYSDIDTMFGTNFCSIGKATKKFDFVFESKVNKQLIVMEVNYYKTQGSKPNETAKSYIELNNKIKNIKGAKFVWITDGQGWNKSRKNLEDAYDEIENLYTIEDLQNGILNIL